MPVLNKTQILIQAHSNLGTSQKSMFFGKIKKFVKAVSCGVPIVKPKHSIFPSPAARSNKNQQK